MTTVDVSPYVDDIIYLHARAEETNEISFTSSLPNMMDEVDKHLPLERHTLQELPDHFWDAEKCLEVKNSSPAPNTSDAEDYPGIGSQSCAEQAFLFIHPEDPHTLWKQSRTQLTLHHYPLLHYLIAILIPLIFVSPQMYLDFWLRMNVTCFQWKWMNTLTSIYFLPMDN